MGAAKRPASRSAERDPLASGHLDRHNQGAQDRAGRFEDRHPGSRLSLPPAAHPTMTTAHDDDPADEQALELLYGRLNYERSDQMPYDKAEFKLDRMRRLLARLGDPHRHPNIVHVAGTKGKGSTSNFLSAMLTQAGYRTGCYTSPHLTRIEERFAVDGLPCTGRELTELVEQVRPAVTELDREARAQATEGPTFFEMTTAMAWLHFQARAVDFIVLEVGLGGRLDSTNVCEPRVCLITSISFDHMRQLGNTLAAIAGEKAGIIKPGVPVITGVSHPEPLEVIQRVADEQQAPLERLGVDFGFQYHPPRDVTRADLAAMDYFRFQRGIRTQIESHILMSVLGEHQAANASLAWAACDVLARQGTEIPAPARRAGVSTSHCPARIEVLRREPTVVIDTAHNTASIQALVKVLRESFPLRRRTLILAATREKDVAGMLHELVPEFDRIICTQYQSNPRQMPVDELARHARRIATAEGSLVEIVRTQSPQAAWQLAVRDSDADTLICATGSFFLAAEMKALLNS